MRGGTLDNRVCAIRGRGEIGKRLEEMNIPVYYLEVKNFFDVKVIFRYRKVLKEFNPDVQVQYLIHADLFGRVVGRLFGVKKCVAYIRNIHRGKRWWLFLDRLTLPLVQILLTNSDAAKRFYVEKMGASGKEIDCIPNGVDLSRFEGVQGESIALRMSLGIPNTHKIIGTIARLERQKDIPTLVKAFVLVKKRNPNLTLLIVGEGREEGALREMIKDYGIMDDVVFLKKRSDIPQLLSLMDIFVLPSFHEGMSNALLEAMAAGRCILASHIEENAELIEHNKEGMLVARGNSAEFAEQMSNMVEHPEKYYAQQENALKKVRERYDIIRVADRYRNFLETV
jgi:glycosyltransferase involved in cell wall biosynthesis